MAKQHRRLILESGKPAPKSIPAEYIEQRRAWLGEIFFEVDGEVTEIEVIPKSKVTLSDACKFLKTQIDELVPDKATEVGFRIYKN